jgi:hypothetical protein
MTDPNFLAQLAQTVDRQENEQLSGIIVLRSNSRQNFKLVTIGGRAMLMLSRTTNTASK